MVEHSRQWLGNGSTTARHSPYHTTLIMNSGDDRIVVGIIDVGDVEIRSFELLAVEDIIDTDAQIQSAACATSQTDTFGQRVAEVAVGGLEERVAQVALQYAVSVTDGRSIHVTYDQYRIRRTRNVVPQRLGLADA